MQSFLIIACLFAIATMPLAAAAPERFGICSVDLGDEIAYFDGTGTPCAHCTW